MWVKYLSFDVALNWENMVLRAHIAILLWVRPQNHSLIVLDVWLKGECGKGNDVFEMYFIPNKKWTRVPRVSNFSITAFWILTLAIFFMNAHTNSVSTLSVHPTYLNFLPRVWANIKLHFNSNCRKYKLIVTMWMYDRSDEAQLLPKKSLKSYLFSQKERVRISSVFPSSTK